MEMENSLTATSFYGEPPVSPAPAFGGEGRAAHHVPEFGAAAEMAPVVEIPRPEVPKAEPEAEGKAPSLERLLLKFGLLTPAQLGDAMREESATGRPLWEIVQERGWVSREDLIRLAERTAEPEAVEAPAPAAPPAPQVVPLPQPAAVVEPPAPAPTPLPDLTPLASAATLSPLPDLTPAAPEPVSAPEPEAVAVAFPPAPEPPFEVPTPAPVVAAVPLAPVVPEVAPAPVAPVVEPAAPVALAPEPVVEVAPVVPEPVAPEPVVEVAPIVPEPVAPEPVVEVAPIVPEPVAPEPVVEVAPIVPEPVAPEPVVEVAPVVPEPVTPVVAFAPEPAVEVVPAAPVTPVATLEEVEPDPGTTFKVVLRLMNGERIDAHTCNGAVAARRHAEELVRGLAAGPERWPYFSGRFVRPESIVSVDVEASL
jgi:hypothetical protein